MATSAQLLALFHLNPVDMTEPYRWEDEQVYSWLSEGQREACIRSRLIYDTATTAVCRVSVTAGTASYATSALIIQIGAVFLVDGDGVRTALNQYDRIELNRIFPEWRTTEDTPTGFVHEGNTLVLNRIPTADATLYIEAYRLPLVDIGMSAQPETPAIHHDELVNWAIYRAHLIEDDDEEQPSGRWRKYLERFEAYFGRKPDADLRRKQLANVQHCNKCWV